MESHLGIIKTDNTSELEKRVLPRFPFNALTFKGEDAVVFSVRDISYSGMQLFLKNGEHSFKLDALIEGALRWKGQTLKVKGQVKWTKEHCLGVAFVENKTMRKNIGDFFSVDNMIAGLRLIDEEEFDLKLPTNLKYWLQNDEAMEIFIWCHSDGEISAFQILLLGDFVEYKDGKGLKSGKVIKRRELDTPLVQEDKFYLQMDQAIDEAKLKFAQNIVNKLGEKNLCPLEIIDFLKIKLGLNTEN